MPSTFSNQIQGVKEDFEINCKSLFFNGKKVQHKILKRGEKLGRKCMRQGKGTETKWKEGERRESNVDESENSENAAVGLAVVLSLQCSFFPMFMPFQESAKAKSKSQLTQRHSQADANTLKSIFFTPFMQREIICLSVGMW